MSSDKKTLGDPMMLSLFRAETETHTETLNSGLLHIEKDISDTSEAESLMRAAHSIKGAARIVNIDMAVTLAHAMEDLFVSIQKGDLLPNPELIDRLLAGTDILKKIGELASDDTIDELMELASEVTVAVAAFDDPIEPDAKPAKETKPEQRPTVMKPSSSADSSTPTRMDDVRISTEHINKLMDLAGEVMVRGKRLEHFSGAFKNIESRMAQINNAIDRLHQMMIDTDDENREQIGDLIRKHTELQENLSQHLNSFESFTFDFITVSSGIHEEAIASRMRPFADGVVGFPRMVRDIAKSENKEVTFEIIGKETRVDRDILQALEAPITHLLRNSIDHGIRLPAEREKAGKERTGTVVLEASHQAGQLMVVVKDDGRGIDIEKLRKKVVERKLTVKDTAAKLTDDELLQFIFLPGFSTAAEVTELSGRGFGLNVVSEMLQAVNGTVRISSEKDIGTEMKLVLPLTLSVINSLVFELNNECYALPLSRIGSCVEIMFDMLSIRDGKTFISLDDRELPLIDGHDALHLSETGKHDGRMTAIIIGSGEQSMALSVDRCIGEHSLVIKPLDRRLGDTGVLSSASIMEDGSTVLSLDIDNLLHMAGKSIDENKDRSRKSKTDEFRSSILVVEDSMTVREMERKLFEESGYAVDTAIDGMDGWNALTTGRYDLIVSDIDMPRMNGLELVAKIRADDRFKGIPVIIVSYKDSEQDRQLGIDAGANYYMTKNSFHDNSIIEIMKDLLKERANENSNS